jgi:hypothetical protein
MVINRERARERLLNVNCIVILIWSLNDNFVTQKITNLLQFARDIYVFLCWQQHPKCNWAVLLVYSPFIRSPSNSHNKTLMLQRRAMDDECTPDSNSSTWVTIQKYIFFLQKLTLLPSKILTFPPYLPVKVTTVQRSVGVFLIMTVCE